MKKYIGLLAVLILAAGSIWYSLAPQFPAALGLDLRGGMRVTLEPDPSKPEARSVSAQTMDQVRSVLENRVNRFGLSGAEVRLKGDRQVLISLPGARDPQQALKSLITVAQLEFRHLDNVRSDRNLNGRYRMDVIPGDATKGEPDTYEFTDGTTNKAVAQEQVVAEAPLLLRGNALQPVSKGEIDPNSGQPIVTFEFKSDGRKIFGDFTTANVGHLLAVVLDGKIITAPNIDEPITQGYGRISGGFRNMVEARLLADLLNSGALPIAMVPAETQTVGATLGQESIQRSIRAGLAGLGIVLLFMLLYYWLPGFVACVALVIYAALTYSIFKGFPFAQIPGIVLDLPGITGFILSIGMAVDGNVLIFERLKEELREGKPLDRAIESGFKRAFSAIIDSNVTVWIISGILIWLGTPMVKGFAITLAIGNAVAMFTAITVTRALLHGLTRMQWARNPALYGINNSWLNLFFPAWRSGGVMRIWDRRRIYFGLSGALVLASLVFILLTPSGKGLQPGIDFTGGSVLEVAFRDPAVTREDVVKVLAAHGAGEAQVRMARSEQPWTTVTAEIANPDAATAQRARGRLAESPLLIGFDPGGYRSEKKGKALLITASFASAATEETVRQALTARGGPNDTPIPDADLKVTAAVRTPAGDERTAVAEIATARLSPPKLQEVRKALDAVGGGTVEPLTRVSSVGPSIAAEVTRNGIFSAVVASVAMLLFLAFRFAIGGFVNGLKFGAGAVLALFHDVLITVGLFAVMGWAAGWPVDSLFLTACLGLLGFSVNDTIVIYDRIRENLGRRRKGETLSEVTDRSMTESFDRSVNTNVAIILALLAMVVFGGDTLRLFNVALLFGMAIGTYSSVFVASPLVVLLERAGVEHAMTAAPPAARPASSEGRPRIGASVSARNPAPAAEPDEPVEPERAAARPGASIRPTRRRRL